MDPDPETRGEMAVLTRCSRCQRLKPLWAFDGKKTCPPCRVRAKRRHAANPGRQRENAKRWHAAHPGHAKRWLAENPERRRENTRRWLAANPERRREIKHRRRARKRGATIGDIPRDAEHQLLGFQAGRCVYCHVDLAETGHHVDHVVPLARGGAHAWDNLVLACPPCNMSKGDKLLEEWRPELL